MYCLDARTQIGKPVDFGKAKNTLFRISEILNSGASMFKHCRPLKTSPALFQDISSYKIRILREDRMQRLVRETKIENTGIFTKSEKRNE